MKLKILFVLFLIPFSILGQDISSILVEWKGIHHKRGRDYKFGWTKFETLPNSVFRRNFFNYVVKDSTTIFCDYDTDSNKVENLIKTHGSKFHFLDIDSDKDLDVIYDGFQCSGFESASVLVYINENGTTFNKVDFSGCVVGWQNGKNLLKIYNYYCCAIPQSNLRFVTFDRDSFSMRTLTFVDNELYYKNKFEFIAKTLPEIEININKGDSLFLQPSNKYNGMMKPPDTNVFGVVESNTTTKYYYEYIDSNNTKWRLITVNCDNLRTCWGERPKLKLDCDKHIAWIKLNKK